MKLTELLLSLILSMLLLNIVIKTFLIFKKNSTHIQTVLQFQTNILLLSELIHSHLKLACFSGLNYRKNNNCQPTIIHNDFQKADILLFWHASTRSAMVLEDTQANSITLSNDIIPKKGEQFIISDSEKSEIFRVDTIFVFSDRNVVTPTEHLQSRFAKNSEVRLFERDEWRVGETDYFDKNHYKVWALFSRQNGQIASAWVDGICQFNATFLTHKVMQLHFVLCEDNEKEAIDFVQAIG